MRFSWLLAVLSFGALICSAAAFVPSQATTPFNPAVRLGAVWMLIGGGLLAAARVVKDKTIPRPIDETRHEHSGGDDYLTTPHPPAPSPLRREGEKRGLRRFIESPLQALGRGFRGGVRKKQQDHAILHTYQRRVPLRFRLTTPASIPNIFPRDWRDQITLLAGMVLLFLVAEVSSSQFGWRWLKGVSHHIQVIAFFGGVTLVVRGMGQYSRRPFAAAIYSLTPNPSPPVGEWHARPQKIAPLKVTNRYKTLVEFKRVPRWERRSVLLILVFAAVLRFWQLEDTMRVLIDEMHFISGLENFWNVPNVPILSPLSDTSPFARFYPYWQTWTVEIFGRGFTGFRAVSVVMGVAQITALWWLARHLFDRYTALLAALLLATFPPHLHYSRVGIIQMGDALAGTMALAFLARGWRTGSHWSFLLAGASLGMTQYFYEAGRLLFPALVIAWMGWAWLTNRSRFDAAMIHNLLRMTITAGIVAFPVYYTMMPQGVWTSSARLHASGRATRFWAQVIFGDAPAAQREYLESLANAFLLYVNRPEERILYGGTQPLVLTVLVPIFFLGMWHLVFRSTRRNFYAVLPLLWIVLTSLGNSLLVESDVTPRYVVVLAALPLVMAAGIRDTVMLVIPHPPAPSPLHREGDRGTAKKIIGMGGSETRLYRGIPSLPQHAVNAMLALGIVIGIGQVGYYFGFHLPYFEVQYRDGRPYRDVEDAILRASRLEPGTDVFFIMERRFSDAYNRNWMNYLTDGITIRTYDRNNMPDDPFGGLRYDRDTAFLVVPGDRDTLEQISEFVELPLPQFSDNPVVPDDRQYALYVVPARDERAAVTPEDSPARQRAELQWLLVGGVMIAAGWAALRSRTWTTYTYNMERWTPSARLTFHELRPAVSLPRYGAALYSIRLSWLRLIPWLMGVGCLVMLTLANVNPEFVINTRAQVALLFGGAALVVGSFSPPPNPLPVDREGERLPSVNASVGAWRAMPLPGNPISRLDSKATVGASWQDAPTTHKIDIGMLAAVGILLLAFAVRVINLDTAVPRLVDEMPSINSVIQLVDDPNTPLLVPYTGVAAFTRLFGVMQQGAVEIFGANLVGLRIISAILGTLTVAAVFRLGRALFDRETALWAALALAVFPPHVHFSRIGINNAADPLFGTLALAFLACSLTTTYRAQKSRFLVGAWRARPLQNNTNTDAMYRDPSALYFALAGAMLGLTQYFYEGGRLLFPALVIGFALIAFIQHERIRNGLTRRRHWVILLLTAVVVAAPVYVTLWLGEYPAAPRLLDTAKSGEYWRAWFQAGAFEAIPVYLRDLGAALSLYAGQRDSSWFYADRVLSPWILPLFGVGVAVAVWRVARGLMRTLPPSPVDRVGEQKTLLDRMINLPSGVRNSALAYALPLVWLLLAALGNSLLVDVTEAPRYVMAFPAVALAVGLSVQWMARLAPSSNPSPMKREGLRSANSPLLSWWGKGTGDRRDISRTTLAMYGIFAAYLIVSQVGFYFGHFTNTYLERYPDVVYLDDIRFRAVDLPGSTHVQIVTDIPVFDTDSYTLMHFTGRDRDGVFISTLPEGDPTFAESLRDLLPGRNFAYFVAPDNAGAIAALEASPYFEGPILSPQNHRPPRGRYWMYFASRERR